MAVAINCYIMKKIILIFAAIMGIMACTKEEQMVGVSNEALSSATLYASFDSEKDTKVTTEDGLSFKIDPSESIGVYVENSLAGAASNVKFNAGEKDEDGWVSFNIDPSSPYTGIPTLLGDVNTKIYAYGPYNVVNGELSAEGEVAGSSLETKSGSSWDGIHYLSLSSSQEQASADDLTSVAKYYAYAAVPTNPVNNGGKVSTKLSFSGIYALIKFEITNSLSESITVNKVKLTTDGALTGDFSVNLKENPKFSNTSFALAGVTEKTKDYVEVSLTTPAVVDAGGKVCLYGVVNSGTFSNASVDVYASNDKGNYFFTKNIENVEGKLPRESRTTFTISMTDDNIYPLTIEGQIARGGEVDVNEAVEKINLNGLDITKDVVVNINASVGEFILYGNNPTVTKSATSTPKITINIAKDVAYPSFNFGYSAQSAVRNVTLVGDPESTMLYAGGMQMWNGENITIDGINFAEGGYITSTGETATGVKNLTIQNCKAIDGKRKAAFITLWRTEGLTIKNNQIISTNKGDGNGCSYANNQDVFVLNSGIKGNVLIEGNTITGSLNHHGIWMANSPEAIAVITNNKITNAYEDAIKIDQAVNVSVTKNTLDAGINGVRFDNFNGTAATLVVTENTISTKATPEEGYGIYLKNKSNTATNVTLTAKDNIVGSTGIKNDKLFAKAESLTVTGDYATPFEFNASSLISYLEQGGEVVIDFPVETIDFNALNISKDLTLTIKAKVNEIKVGGNVDSNDILIKIEKDVEYPKITFNENAKNLTIQGDVTSSKLYSNNIKIASGAKSITIDGIKFNYVATSDNSYTIEVDTNVDGLTVSNCIQEGLGQRFVHVLNSEAKNINILNNAITALDGSRNSGPGREMDVLYFKGASQVKIEDNTITNSMDHHAIYVDGGTDFTITKNTINNAYEDAIKVDRATLNVNITENTLSANRNGVRFDNFSSDASGIVITGNTISTKAETTESYAIHFKNAASVVTVAANVNNNKVGTIEKDQYCRVNTEKITISGDADKAFTLVEGERYITLDNAFGLNNANALQWFATEVNTNENTFSGKTVKLLSDVTLSGNWTPIGASADDAKKFQGIFDGNNKTINGLIVNQTAGYHAAGFFGALNGTAKNFTIDGATVTSISEGNTDGNTSNGTAVVAGSIYNTGLISGVTVKNSKVDGNRYVAGIAGYVYGKIEKCRVESSTITSTPDNLKGSYDNGDKAGGIAGYFPTDASNTIEGCTVKNITVQAYRDLGGIAGCAAGSISNCVVEGNLTLIQNNTNGYKSDVTTIGSIIGRDALGVPGKGASCTEPTDLDVKIIGEVTTSERLSSILNGGHSNTVTEVDIVLANDMSVNHYAPELTCGENVEKITIVGKNADVKLSLTASGIAGFWVKKDGTPVTIKNLKIEGSTTMTNHTWDVYDINFKNSELTLENVTFNKSVALNNVGYKTTFNNVTINETSHDLYALWVVAGNDLTITGGSITGLASGNTAKAIKISDQYVDSPTKTVLEVTDTKFVSGKKAAILVGSKSETDITLSNVDISGVVADKTNAVWIDSDYVSTTGNVTVTGGTKVNEQ